MKYSSVYFLIFDKQDFKFRYLNFIMKWKCLFGFHKWEKFMGLINIGQGKFRQRYKCNECGKIKEVVK